MFQNINDAYRFIKKTSWMGAKLDLSRITRLCALLGEPQKKLRFVHIAGTNGKGSTAAMVSSVLVQAGFTTGLYTSPELVCFGERMQVNGCNATDDEIMGLAWEVKKASYLMEEPPTEFEVITAMALLHFTKNKCDIVVFEVGMGGRLDATNVIDAPLVSVITSIGLDHTEFLGDTKEKIAGEKAGIIKEGTFVVSHPQEARVEEVIRRKCQSESAEVKFVAFDDIMSINADLDGQRFMYRQDGSPDTTREYFIPLLGRHQLQNAAAAIEVIFALRNKGLKITQDDLLWGLKKTKWQGRFEVLRKNPPFILDVAHNPSGVKTAVKTLASLFPKKKFVFVMGVLKDKDYAGMIEQLIPFAQEIIFVPTETDRGLPSSKLGEAASKLGFSAIVKESIKAGIETATLLSQGDGAVCALGSFTIVPAVKRFVSG